MKPQNDQNGYEKRTAAKKEAVVKAARELFCQRGVQGVTVAEIARKAQVSQVSIYNYFKDKDSLAREAFASLVSEAIFGIEEMLAAPLPFEEKLEQLISYKLSLITAVSASGFSEAASDDKALRRIFGQATREASRVVFEKFILSGQEGGAIDPSIPLEAAVDYLETTLSLLQSPPFMASAPERKEGVMKLFLYGLIGKK